MVKTLLVKMNFFKLKKKEKNKVELKIIQRNTLSYTNINKNNEKLNLEIKNIGSNTLSKDCYIKGNGNYYFIDLTNLETPIYPNSTIIKQVEIKCKAKNKERNQQIKISLCDNKGNEITSIETSVNINFDEEDTIKGEYYDNGNSNYFNYNEQSEINLNNINLEDNLVGSKEFEMNLKQLKENFQNNQFGEDYLREILERNNGDYDKTFKILLDQLIKN